MLCSVACSESTMPATLPAICAWCPASHHHAHQPPNTHPAVRHDMKHALAVSNHIIISLTPTHVHPAASLDTKHGAHKLHGHTPCMKNTLMLGREGLLLASEFWVRRQHPRALRRRGPASLSQDPSASRAVLPPVLSSGTPKPGDLVDARVSRRAGDIAMQGQGASGL